MVSAGVTGFLNLLAVLFGENSSLNETQNPEQKSEPRSLP
jgi:hypothetical protein